MKLYRCTKNDAGIGTLLSWHASKRAADAELRRHQRERNGQACGPECVDEVIVPTDKAGLLVWLNTHVDVDNG